jgi:hypothetical protein
MKSIGAKILKQVAFSPTIIGCSLTVTTEMNMAETSQTTQWKALKKIVKRLPAHLAYYGSALGAIVIAGSSAEGMASIVGNVGAGLLGNLIADVAKGEDIIDDDIRQRAEEAVTRSDIERLLTERDFWRGYVQLIRRLDAQKATSQDILDELRDGFSKVATAEQLEEVKELLLQALGDKKPSLKPRVFISYRRSDASDFAQRLHDALEAADIDTWLDVRDMPSGDTFIAQIDRAIAAADYFLLVGTPQAIESDYCRDEWKKAIEKYKPIIPVMLMGEYKDLPQEAYAYLNDARDFRDDSQFDAQVAQLVKQIQVNPAPAGEVRGLPSLPSHYLPRPELLATLREALTQHKTTVLTSPSQKVGVQGMGGVGKSVLAMALARDYFVRRTFKDGVFWLTLGTAPRLFDVWTQLAGYLSYEGKSFKDAKEAQDFFEQATQGKEILLILDDVWQSDHAEAFLHLGENCRLFASSRQKDILSAIDAHTYAIGILSDTEAEALLKRVAKVDVLPAQGNGIIQACGNLPLAIAMIGAMVQGKPATYWQDALDALEEADLEGIAARFPEYPHANLFLALKVSIDALDADLRERYYDFAIFPDDVAIPEEVPLTFWKPAKARDVRKKLDALVSRNLLTRADDGTLSLHDLQLSYIRREVQDKPRRHERLLAQYRPNHEAWRTVCDAYLWKYLAHHLSEVGRVESLRKLLLDIRWLQAKLDATDLNTLLADCTYLPDDEVIRLIKSALTLSRTALTVDTRVLAGQLVGRLWVHRQRPDIATLLDSLSDAASRPCLLPIENGFDLLTATGELILAVMIGHTAEVRGALELNDGTILSWCGDNLKNPDYTLRTWRQDGTPLAVMTGHRNMVWGALALDDGTILSWSWDGTLRTWSRDGTQLAVMTGHEGNVWGALVLDDGTILSWSWVDNTLRTWNQDAKPLAIMTGHTDAVWGALALDDGTILSWSRDGRLRTWRRDGTPLAIMTGHTKDVRGALVLGDGTVLSWSDDTTLRTWRRDGTALTIMTEHKDHVEGVLVLDDGTILSWSDDTTLRTWSRNGTPLAVMTGHTADINGALTLDDGTILSWSDDKTLRTWSRNGTPLAVMTGHTADINGALTLDDGTILSWSDDKTLRRWAVSPNDMGQEVAVTEETALAVLTGHKWSVKGALALDDDTILSWSGDHTLRTWRWDGSAKPNPTSHSEEVTSLLALDDNTIVSCSHDTTLRTWDGDGTPLAIMTEHYAIVWGALALDDGTILSWSNDTTLRTWKRDGTRIAVMSGHGDRGYVRGALALDDGTILSWSHNGTLRTWMRDGTPLAVMTWQTGHETWPWRVDGALALDDGKILSWSNDGVLRTWNKDGTLISDMARHGAYVGGALALDDGTILSWSGDKTLRTWRRDGTPLAVMTEHTDNVDGALALDDNTILSWSHDGTLRWWTPNRALRDTLEVGSHDPRQWNRTMVFAWARKQGVNAHVLFAHVGDPAVKGGRAACNENTVYVYSATNGQTLARFISDARITGLAVLPNDVIAAGDETGHVFFLRWLPERLK